MAFLNGKNKQQKSAVWRDRSGNIRCLGDSCPQKDCDDSCPIWLSTMAASMLAIGEMNSALSSLEKASIIAPDFYDAWNNMGTIYGLQSNYKKAYDCYMKAHEVMPSKFQPVFGLALTSRDLKLYEECIRWCDEYDKLCSDNRCDDIRATANSALSRKAAPSESQSPHGVYSPAEICLWLLAEGKTAGYVEDEKAFPNIPEIMSQARHVVMQILDETRKASPQSFGWLSACWSVYAAMGAVRFWYDDWDRLKKTGIYESLTAPRGIEEMDEFVCDYIGWMFESEKSKEFASHIRRLGITAFVKISKQIDDDFESKMNAYINMLMGFYYYGMIIEMNELGMH